MYWNIVKKLNKMINLDSCFKVLEMIPNHTYLILYLLFPFSNLYSCHKTNSSSNFLKNSYQSFYERASNFRSQASFCRNHWSRNRIDVPQGNDAYCRIHIGIYIEEQWAPPSFCKSSNESYPPKVCKFG